ncbi:MAG: C-terminal target protein [Bacteroidetes bacterium]|jgi:hypothetical protein|nr:C-terminal target protein [Bacteroidota bacterium]
MKKKILVLFFGLIITCSDLSSQNFYSIDTIQQIEIQFSQSNWDYILDTAKQGSDSYTMATWVKINGVQFDSAGVKYKGNSSYNPANAKNPLHIELDHFKDQDYYGIKDIKLSNGYHEPSSVREVLLYGIARKYMPASYANYAEVIVNGSAMGLYTNVEAITKKFLDDRFYSDNNSFVFADNGGCNLVYRGTDTTLYYTPYTLKSDHGWTDLADLCGTLKNNISSIENILDVDRALWMLAFTNVTVTLDSYLGQSTHNYYLYQDHNNRFNPIIWDLNGGLGVFNKLSMGPSLTVAQMKVMSPMVHSNDSLWPLVKNILAVPMYKRMYLAHMRTILNENFMDSSYYNTSAYLQSIIDSEVSSDPNAFYSHTDFVNNLNIDVIDGPKVIPGIGSFMEARKSYLNSTAEFQQVPPTIDSLGVSDTLPSINTSVFITASVTNANQVYLGFRNDFMDQFSRLQMFDDGTHGDGSAGDGVYGIYITLTTTYLQYYIYAENLNAGIFSPQRAEYEYHVLNIEKGIVINEVMPDNQTTQADNYSEYNDWIELYNNSNSAVDLSGYHLSDNASDPAKWTFPAGTMINANGFLIVWADNDTNQVTGLHAHFKLSASGESIFLSNSSMQIIDEITFPTQSTDKTYGRYPNGTGSFATLNPTFNSTNSEPISVEETHPLLFSLKLFPNPANELLNIEYEAMGIHAFYIYNSIGELIRQGNINNSATLDLNAFSEGMYFIRIHNISKRFIVTK